MNCVGNQVERSEGNVQTEQGNVQTKQDKVLTKQGKVQTKQGKALRLVKEAWLEHWARHLAGIKMFKI